MDLVDFDIWGGVECTVNRVGDTYFDQIIATGHHSRLSDLDIFRDLGLKTLRVPILWERTAPDKLSNADWLWPDRYLGRLNALGITPIAGLLHHGSGPRYTDLLDPNFPRHFASYAEAVARRYPEINLYTPINEPLTTARFSCLYGHWFPHLKNTKAFIQALINQCYATSFAMNAIRKVNSKAQLVQTEDLGKIAATPRLAYQAEFENARRWLTFDLLTGKVDRNHPLWKFIIGLGIHESILFKLQDMAVAPDILGINHYVTSNRFLDHRLHLYPPALYGGNFDTKYVDVEWIRVEGSPPFILDSILQETWERYHTPIAVTEAHLGCNMIEEQAAWFGEVVRAAETAQSGGADIRAVTAWALLGSYDWDKLLTAKENHYERGVFEVIRGVVSRTENSYLLQKLIQERRLSDTFTNYKGWWHRNDRYLFPKRSPEADYGEHAP